MRAPLIHEQAYELSAHLEPSRVGFHLAFESYVPIARRPERQRRFDAMLSKAGLLRLRWLIDDVLHASGEVDLERPIADRLKTLRPDCGPHVDIAFLYHLATARRRRLGALQAMADGRAALTADDLHWLARLLDSSLGRLQVPETPLSERTARALAAALSQLVHRSPCFPFDAEPLIGSLDRLPQEEEIDPTLGQAQSPGDAAIHST